MIRRLLSPEYWVVSEPGPLGGSWPFYALLGALFVSLMAGAVWKARPWDRNKAEPAARAWAWLEAWVCAAGIGAVLGRFFGWPGWSARIWPVSFAALAVLIALTYRLRNSTLPPWLSHQLQVLALVPMARPQEATARTGSKALPLAALLLHTAGTALVLSFWFGLPSWLAPLAVPALLSPQFPAWLRDRVRPQLLPLTPLLAAYAVTLLALLYRELDITVVEWQGLQFPNPMQSLFYGPAIVLASATHAVLCQLHAMRNRHGLLCPAWRSALLGLLAAVLAWTLWIYLGKRTHGVTASDPYAYAQMGVDLAERGTFLHRYPLFEETQALGLPAGPVHAVGYHLPRTPQGDSPSVWATGASVLLGVGYLLLGEEGLYLTTPLVALVALGAVWALTQEVLRRESLAVRYLAGGIALALTATSPEYLDRVLVPMADAAAQLFTVATLWLALRAMRHLEAGTRRALGDSLLAGVVLAWAYWVRHTQLVLALVVVMAVFIGASRRKASRRLALGCLLTFCAAAALTAIPDIVYRWRVFGGILATETTELPAMGMQHVGSSAWQMLRDALVAGEWGYLLPLALYGGYRLVRLDARAALLLGSALASVLAVHLPYRFLRLRDLISLFPLVNVAIAYAAVWLVRWAQRIAGEQAPPSRLGPAVSSACAVSYVLLALALARWTMVDDLWKPGWASFGYVRPDQRLAFDRIAELTPEKAVVGASLNAGAVALYTGRDALRPYDGWTADDWNAFVDAMQAKGRAVYLLDDGPPMARFIQDQESRYQLSPIALLSIPVFQDPAREEGWLYRVEARP